jgi:spore coat protein U-like protein
MLLLAMGSAGDEARAELTASFQVSATLVSGCAVDGLGMAGDAGTLGQLDFGQAMALATTVHSANLTLSQTIVLRCTPGTALTMTVGAGQHFASGSRHLQLGVSDADRLQYRLYRDAGFTQEIGVDQAQSISISSGNMNDVQLPLHGRLILPGERVPGTYTDTLLVTLDW